MKSKKTSASPMADFTTGRNNGRERYFVPEVNYGKHNAIEPMIRDMQAVGFEFSGQGSPIRG